MYLDIKKIKEQIVIKKNENDEYIATHPCHPTLEISSKTVLDAEKKILEQIVYLGMLNKISSIN